MRMMKFYLVSIFLLSGFSAFSASRDYASVFKKKVIKNTTTDFQTHLVQDVQSLYNILSRKKVVAVLTTAQKKATSENGNLPLKLK